MATLGVIACEILELEIAHLIASDKDVDEICVIESPYSARLIRKITAAGARNLKPIPGVRQLPEAAAGSLRVLVRILELGLHNNKKTLQNGLVEAARELDPFSDALVLGYGLCGNALVNPAELLAETDAPLFLPMDEDSPVDDCIALLMGGRERYYRELKNVAGTFFMTPGWACHWENMFKREFGNIGIDLARRLFENYERSLLIVTPLMSEREMRENVAEFNRLFDFRMESCEGSLHLLTQTWNSAKASVLSKSSMEKAL